MYYLAYIKNQQEFLDSHHSGSTKFPTENTFSSFNPFRRFKDSPTSQHLPCIVPMVCLLCNLMKSPEGGWGLCACIVWCKKKQNAVKVEFLSHWDHSAKSVLKHGKSWFITVLVYGRNNYKYKMYNINIRARNTWHMGLGLWCVNRIVPIVITNLKSFSIWMAK